MITSRHRVPQICWPDGMDEAAFIRDYWQQKPLLIRGALPDFDCPLSPDEFVGFTMDADFPSRLIRHTPEAEKQWQVTEGPFDEATLTNLPSTNWSILITDVEKHLPEFQEYLQPFRFVPDWRIDDLMISYAPEGASVGAHTDAYDVFLFQAAGKRRWSIQAEGQVDETYIPDQDVRILQNFAPDQTWDLQAGDLLYLPPGVPHHGVSLDNDCMTWSVGFRAPLEAEFVADVSQEIFGQLFTNSEARFSDPAFEPQEHPGQISAQAIAQFRALWDQFANPTDEQFADMLGRFLTKDASSDLLTLDEAKEEKGDDVEDWLIDPNQAFEIESFANLAFIENGAGMSNEASLFFNGEALPCSLKLAQTLTAAFEIPAGTLQSFLDDPQDAEAMNLLVAAGALVPLEDQ